MDADMIPHPDLIYQHFKLLKNKKNTSIVGLELRTLTNEEYNHILNLLSKVKEIKDIYNLFEFSFSNRSRKILKIRKIEWYKFLTGNLSSSRESFIKAGLFDNSFIHYGFEDLELGYRFEKLGYKIIFNPKALTIHLHPLTIEKRIQNKIESVNNLKIFFNKYKNPKILKILGINFYSKIIYNYLPPFIKEYLKNKNNDYLTNYNFWQEWNKKND